MYHLAHGVVGRGAEKPVRVCRAFEQHRHHDPNLYVEGAAHETPVVSSMVGGIPEVVAHDETGLLVPVAQQSESPFAPLYPSTYAKDLAQQVNLLMEDPKKRKRFARAGRKRAVERFSWTSIAKQTRDLYAALKNPNS